MLYLVCASSTNDENEAFLVGKHFTPTSSTSAAVEMAAPFESVVAERCTLAFSEKKHYMFLMHCPKMLRSPLHATKTVGSYEGYESSGLVPPLRFANSSSAYAVKCCVPRTFEFFSLVPFSRDNK